jgi:hypothetical protein
MKYINELAYSNHIAQTKHLAKDKRQKNKYRQMPLLDKTQDCDDVHEEDLNQLSTHEN